MPRPQFRSLTPRQIVFDVVVAVMFVPLFGFGAFDQFFGVADGALGTILVLVAVVTLAGALAVRRLSPGLSLALAWLAAVLQMSFGLGPQPFDIAIFAVVYVTAAYGTRRVMQLGLLSAVAGAAVAAGFLMLVVWAESGSPADMWRNGFTWFLTVAALLLLSWTVGALVRSSRTARENRAAQQRAELDAASEQERGRIARDMHDVVAHSLAVVVAQADGARYAADADPQAAKDALATISQTARSALTDVRLLLAQLRHRQGEGPQPTLADLEGLFAQVRGAGVELAVDIDPVAPGEPPAAVQLAVYRILQEALTNALRHGAGGGVDVRMAWREAGLDLAVTNLVSDASLAAGARGGAPDGRAAVAGRVPDEPAAPTSGHGIVGMTERAQLVGGGLTAAADGRMFVVRAHLPVSGYARTAPAGAAGAAAGEDAS